MNWINKVLFDPKTRKLPRRYSNNFNRTQAAFRLVDSFEASLWFTRILAFSCVDCGLLCRPVTISSHITHL